MMKLTDYLQNTTIFEGGGLGKKFGAVPIEKRNIDPTVEYFLDKFKEVTQIFININEVKILGSGGQKEISGDIDISVSKNISQKLVQYLIDELQKSPKRDLFIKNAKKSFIENEKEKFIKLNENEKEEFIKLNENKIIAIASLKFGRSVGSPFDLDAKGIKLLTTIEDFDLDDGMPGLIPFVSNVMQPNGTLNEKKVQIDLNFGDQEWMSFAYHYTPEESPNEKPIKGLHRNIILECLIETLGGVWGFQKGFKISKNDIKFNENKTQFIDFLNKKLKFNIEEKDLKTFFNILNIVKKLNKNIRTKIFNLMINKLGHSLVPAGVYIPTEKDFNL